MTRVIAVLAVLTTVGCASVQARRENGVKYTCYPNRAMDRGPFQPEVPAGTAGVALEGFSVVGHRAWIDHKPYTCVANSAMERGPFQPRIPAGEHLTVR